MTETINISSQEMLSKFERILLSRGFEKENALQCAQVFTSNSVDGVYSHGVNRFASFVKMVDAENVKPNNTPSLKSKFAGIEQWDGNFGAGPLNAMFATNQAIGLSQQHGIGCVALANTNHWMRGGAYGWHAAKQGHVFIGWTNTIGNMPAWGATDNRLGNNPFVLAVPYKDEAIVLDMAMSQYSYGKMELAKMKGEKLDMVGGYDASGALTNDPAAILQTRRTIPVGYWKGAGLTLLLDILATILSGGLSTADINAKGIEYASQVFIAIDISKLGNHASIPQMVNNIITDYHESLPENNNEIIYPGERVVATRKKNIAEGMPVIASVWEEIQLL